MGVAISDYNLANAVAREGHLGVVSGTGIQLVLIARLTDGDPGGHVRRALAAFPDQEVAMSIIDKYYVEGGKAPEEPYKRPTMWSMNPPHHLLAETVVANFVEVWLAKEGHDNPIGINLLEKVQMPNMASLYGAMLAGVDVVIIGAGIPIQIPGILDKLAKHEDVFYRLDVIGAEEDEDFRLHFRPQEVFPQFPEQLGDLHRPLFFPIISSNVLALALQKRSTGKINGFVIELPSAGGHNAPPRGKMELNEKGEPIYTDKDKVNLEKIRKMGLPFWLAGGYGTPEKLQEALDAGAQGIQVGTAFAYCNESGMEQTARQRVIDKVLKEEAEVLTSSRVSPTGFPFKVVNLEGTLADDEIYEARPRICDIGFLRTPYRNAKGGVGFRCTAEPVDTFLKKGGKLEDTVGRTCLCNALGSAAKMPQMQRYGYLEPLIITSGDDLVFLKRYMKPGERSYSAREVLEYLQMGVVEPAGD